MTESALRVLRFPQNREQHVQSCCNLPTMIMETFDRLMNSRCNGVWPIQVRFLAPTNHTAARIRVKCDRLGRTKYYKADRFSSVNAEYEAVVNYLKDVIEPEVFDCIKPEYIGRLVTEHGDKLTFFITDDIFEIGRKLAG